MTPSPSVERITYTRELVERAWECQRRNHRIAAAFEVLMLDREAEALPAAFLIHLLEVTRDLHAVTVGDVWALYSNRFEGHSFTPA